MSAPTPQSLSNKPSLRILLGPPNPSSWPLVVIVFEPVVFEGLERVLLIVCCKFKTKRQDREDAENTVGSCERGMWLKECSVSGNAEEQENNVLCDG
jgi:hypothetical protein